MPIPIPITHMIAGDHILQSLRSPGTNGSVRKSGTGKIGFANTIARTAASKESTKGKYEVVPAVSFGSGAFIPRLFVLVTIPIESPAATRAHPAKNVVEMPPNIAYHSSTKNGFETTAAVLVIAAVTTSKTDASTKVQFRSSVKSGDHNEDMRSAPATHALWLNNETGSPTSCCCSALTRAATAKANCEPKMTDHISPKIGLRPLDPPPPKSRGLHGTGFFLVTSPMETRVGNRLVAEKTHSSPDATNPDDTNCTTSVSVDMLPFFSDYNPCRKPNRPLHRVGIRCECVCMHSLIHFGTLPGFFRFLSACFPLFLFGQTP